MWVCLPCDNVNKKEQLYIIQNGMQLEDGKAAKMCLTHASIYKRTYNALETRRTTCTKSLSTLIKCTQWIQKESQMDS